ncbi:hypothetical protein [Hymenobacter latericus]|uniref:hypothetical protein n=1 Tax=Hymenobacter sp. YIM 151858-1 TaxID=2987688 RepID=UPI0022275446|nr:hypothetical protein [Hymenobacter sp. YIM 151858-1]UYZ57538.1 hypothetical protein OIS50_10700 [Hymenobacter sp. YIM 151858-1]
MNIRSMLLAAGLAGASAAAAVAQDAPRQLSTPPTVADTVRRSAAAPAQAQPAPEQAAPPQQAPQPRYRIGLKSGQVYAADDVELRQPVIGRSYLLLNGQQRFDLDQIKFYQDETGHYIRTTLPGSRREATLRREKQGRISTYSITSQSWSPGGFGGPWGYGPYGYGMGRYGFGSPWGMAGYPYGGGYRTVKTEYFSKDGGPIQDMNFRNLSVALSDNPGSAELLRDAARLKRVSTAGYIVGGGMLVAGMLNTFSGNAQRISPLLFISVPVLLVPTFVSGSQANKLKQAVQMYNYNGAATR